MPDKATITHEICRTRRSYRKFKADPIPRETLDRILTSACWAPSSMNQQPWNFFVLTDEMRDRLAALHRPVFEQMEQQIRERYGEHGVDLRRHLYMNLGDAPVAVVCFTDIRDGKADKVSAALACENLVLAAWGEGVGSLIMASSLLIKDEISFLCGVDVKKMEMVMAILLGYPDEEPESPERRKKRVIYASSPADIRH